MGQPWTRNRVNICASIREQRWEGGGTQPLVNQSEIINSSNNRWHSHASNMSLYLINIKQWVYEEQTWQRVKGCFTREWNKHVMSSLGPTKTNTNPFVAFYNFYSFLNLFHSITVLRHFTPEQCISVTSRRKRKWHQSCCDIVMSRCDNLTASSQDFTQFNSKLRHNLGL